jgi:hypothetical protein
MSGRKKRLPIRDMPLQTAALFEAFQYSHSFTAPREHDPVEI